MTVIEKIQALHSVISDTNISDPVDEPAFQVIISEENNKDTSGLMELYIPGRENIRRLSGPKCVVFRPLASISLILSISTLSFSVPIFTLISSTLGVGLGVKDQFVTEAAANDAVVMKVILVNNIDGSKVARRFLEFEEIKSLPGLEGYSEEPLLRSLEALTKLGWLRRWQGPARKAWILNDENVVLQHNLGHLN